MGEQDFSIMEEVVEDICNSLESGDTPRWEVTTYTLHDKENGVTYFLCPTGKYITDLWNESSTITVFSHEQGVRIHQSLIVFKSLKGNKYQQQLIRSVNKNSKQEDRVAENKKKFWQFWK